MRQLRRMGVSANGVGFQWRHYADLDPDGHAFASEHLTVNGFGPVLRTDSIPGTVVLFIQRRVSRRSGGWSTSTVRSSRIVGSSYFCRIRTALMEITTAHVVRVTR